ncbi:transforming growth factor beta-1-induced transcript 1 protein-like [Agrilus planipennis]|uniref:Transforming growth factor beta-1-induced transcript 1 protein-like n=1 Tax=Agrilus planipennis TaxID=224129 RepID=A0A1W4XMK4_AGRPL|nr:transforming growth factor beta-1-induced transcript 1 protein-like [Agrilus planipennis]
MSSKGPTICASCNAPISNKILSALGNHYHPEHFTCHNCKQPIGDEKFQQHDGFPYCGDCYTHKFAKKCHACKLPIKNKIIKALDVTWHEDCFACTICKKPLTGTSFAEKDGNPFCEKDYNEHFADRCKDCGKPITDQAIIALDAKWHQKCFKCLKCKKPITKTTFQVEDGHPLCGDC